MSFQITVEPSGRRFTADDNETLLTAGIREVEGDLHLQSFVLDSDFPEARLLEVRLPQ